MLGCVNNYMCTLLTITDIRARADPVWKDKVGYVETAWKFFEGSTMSIEILKDDQLQKAYFHVRDKVSDLVTF